MRSVTSFLISTDPSSVTSLADRFRSSSIKVYLGMVNLASWKEDSTRIEIVSIRFCSIATLS